MRFGGGQLSEEDQKKVKDLMDKELAGRSLRDLSQEERQKIFAKVQEQVKLPAAARPGGQQAGATGQAGGRGESASRGVGRGTQGEEGPPGGAQMPIMGFSAPRQFSDKDLENAKLPPPPEEDSQLEVLLRPGLLADVEIIVEKIPNAIHIPAQAVFEKDGKPVVYVKKENTFEPRLVKPLKRSESTMVIAEGLQAGELVALADPTARKGEKKKEEKPAGGSGPTIPAGGGSRGGR
jgi:hypothetical protein